MMVDEFVHDVGWGDLPVKVKGQARRCLLDVLGAAVGGRRTAVSGIIHDFAAAAFGGGGAYLWVDGREV
ncbi:MAG: MmgE/PrpD family protein, partial [Candidatus Promineifilaceae bacterium]